MSLNLRAALFAMFGAPVMLSDDGPKAIAKRHQAAARAS
ncbi:hypothetical protein J2764_000270 [Agrobacterium tumefaciens]|nr:hypothetical protein [Agrobacterium tumefaciens]